MLIDAGFDAFAETTCKPYYAAKMGAPSISPGRYFRIHMVGYFEGNLFERGIEWRCADSLSLREFLRLRTTERVPDHSWLSKTRSRLPQEVHEEVFGWVLALIAEHEVFGWVLALIADHGLVKGERIGVDASTMEANAAPGRQCAGRRRDHLGDAEADGRGERDRDAVCRRSRSYRSHAQGQETLRRCRRRSRMLKRCGNRRLKSGT